MKKIIALLLVFVMVLPGLTAFGEEAVEPAIDIDALIANFNNILELTEARYVFGITKEELLQSAVDEYLRKHPEAFAELAKAAYEALDPNSYYLTDEEFEDRLEDVNQQFSGIGVSVALLNGKAIITKVHKNTPAIVNGLKEGDVITAVEGEEVAGYNLEKVVSLIRGPVGSYVTLTINRNGVSIYVTLPRAIVTVPTVEYENLNQNNAGYVKIDSFSANTLYEMDDAMYNLMQEGVDKIILDLRNNLGGYLTAGVVVASLFVPEGELITVEDYADDDKDRNYYSGGDHQRFKVVVLVNEYTASASEIVTGAIKDYKLGPVVGTKTYGKGTVQNSQKIINSGAIWLTVAKYNLPSGANINEVGIQPDYVVENTKAPVDLTKFVKLNREQVFKYGDVSDQVLSIKQHLSAIGYSFMNMDNKYDDELVEVVTAFQSATQLYPYGVCDFTTQAKILEIAEFATEEVDNQLEKAKELIFEMK